MVSNLFEVYRFGNLLFVFKQLFLFIFLFLFLLFEFLLKFNKFWLQVGLNSRNELLVHLFELLFLILSTLD